MHDFKKLTVWQKAITLTIDVHKLTEKFPRHQLFGLARQLNNCSISIPSNVSEGSCRNSDKEFHRFLSIAAGSSAELETQLIIANKLDYINDSDFNTLIKSTVEIRNMLYGLQKTLNES